MLGPALATTILIAQGFSGLPGSIAHAQDGGGSGAYSQSDGRYGAAQGPDSPGYGGYGAGYGASGPGYGGYGASYGAPPPNAGAWDDDDRPDGGSSVAPRQPFSQRAGGADGYASGSYGDGAGYGYASDGGYGNGGEGGYQAYASGRDGGAYQDAGAPPPPPPTDEGGYGQPSRHQPFGQPDAGEGDGFGSPPAARSGPGGGYAPYGYAPSGYGQGGGADDRAMPPGRPDAYDDDDDGSPG